MSKIGQQADTINVQGENESVPSEQLLGLEDGKRSYKLFQGHAGPVYSTTFSPLGDFILSSSDTAIECKSCVLQGSQLPSLGCSGTAAVSQEIQNVEPNVKPQFLEWVDEKLSLL